MIVGVRALKDLWKEDSPCFGNKANTLSMAIKWGVAVLPGFCVTFDLEQKFDSQLQNFSTQIERAYRNLINDRKDCHVIVRSSVDLEDGENARFPGIFCSFSGVSTLSQLYRSIQDCFDSVWRPAAKYYAQANAVGQQFRYFTALVQEELNSQYAGLATTQIPLEGYAEERVMLASLTKGNNHELVKGIGPSNTYSFYLDCSGFHARRISGNALIGLEEQSCVLQKLYHVLSELKRKADREVEVEWGYSGGRVYIFQIRFSPELASVDTNPRERAIVSFSSDAEQGLKYQAMRFFQQQGLFPRKTLFFPRELPTEDVAQAICAQDLEPPITVRFSQKGEIGLPRAFASDRVAAASYVRSAKQPGWSVIAYSSLTVRKSFELYLDRDEIILEYVPGMWESDSVLATDTVLLIRKKACFWLANQPRNARYEDEKGVRTTLVPPSSFEQMRKELTQRIPTIRKLQEMFSRDLPLNFHFVSDGEQDYFLNCRCTHRIVLGNWYGGPVQVVEDVADCSRWDGRSAILFRPKLHRGEELLLFQFIPFLKSLPVPIFVEFGILSHPAIMLRELGVYVLPYFLFHDYYEMLLEEI